MSEISVVTFPLITEKWQEDVLSKRFEVCRNIYNAMIGQEFKKYRKMISTDTYKNSVEIIYSYYRETDEKEKKRIKASAEYKEALKVQRELMKENGFSEYDFKSEAIRASKHFEGLIPTTVASMSIGTPMWKAFEKLFFGNGNTVHFKKYDSWTSILSDNKSGIRIVSEDNKTTKRMDCNQNYYVLLTGKVGKNLKMKLKVDRKDLYLLEMMERDIHTTRITRKKVKGKYKYYVQLAVSGAPAIKYLPNGERKHNIGEKKLGIYIDTTCITIYDGDTITTQSIKMENDIKERIAEINRYLDASRRATNPDNFNENGTIKKGIVQNGLRMPLTWTYSNSYKRAVAEKANLLRRQKEQRKIRANAIANDIMSKGCEVCINDYPFQFAAMKKKFQEGEEKNENGRYKKKAKAGKTIGNNGPAMIVTILDNKLKNNGFSGVKKVKLKDVDYTRPEYRKVSAAELYANL